MCQKHRKYNIRDLPRRRRAVQRMHTHPSGFLEHLTRAPRGLRRARSTPKPPTKSPPFLPWSLGLEKNEEKRRKRENWVQFGPFIAVFPDSGACFGRPNWVSGRLQYPARLPARQRRACDASRLTARPIGRRHVASPLSLASATCRVARRVTVDRRMGARHVATRVPVCQCGQRCVASPHRVTPPSQGGPATWPAPADTRQGPRVFPTRALTPRLMRPMGRCHVACPTYPCASRRTPRALCAPRDSCMLPQDSHHYLGIRANCPAIRAPLPRDLCQLPRDPCHLGIRARYSGFGR